MSQNEDNNNPEVPNPEEFDPAVVTSGRKMSRQRLVTITTILVIIAMFWLTWELYARTDPLRFKYVKASVDLVIDGEPITIEGMLECRYHWPNFGIGSHFKASEARGFVSRRPSGGAIVVSVPSCEYSRYNRSPVVHLLDDPDRPTRIEYHFSEQALSDPASRVHIVRYTAELDGRSPISQWWRLWQLTAFEDAIGWAREEPRANLFRGYLLTLTPRSLTPEKQAFAPHFEASTSSLVSSQDTDDPLITKAITNGQFAAWGAASHCEDSDTTLLDPTARLACFQLMNRFGAPPTDRGFSFDNPTALSRYVVLLPAPDHSELYPIIAKIRGIDILIGRDRINSSVLIDPDYDFAIHVTHHLLSSRRLRLFSADYRR